MSAKKNRTESSNSRTHGNDLRRALDWVLATGIFDEVRRHGNVNWTAVALIRLAVFWVWSAESSLVESAKLAIRLVTQLFGEAPVKSYQGLTNALKNYSGELLPRLWSRLQNLMKETGEGKYRIGIWLALAIDGSRGNVPRTWKNEQRFCKPSGKKKKKKRKAAQENRRSRYANRMRARTSKKSHYDPQPVGPQLWLTMIWHIGLNLPWCWKIGPSYSSERAHVLEMIAGYGFPKNTLFCGDAGFFGYDFWQAILAQDHHFLVRVGANVRLLKRLGYVREHAGIVYFWPDAAAKKKLPPLTLRLLHFKDGRGDVYLVTNVLDKRQLTDRQASDIYRKRWGIELQFRAIKQTFGRSKLRSRTPDCAEIEMHWSLVGLWIIQLLCVKEQTRLNEPEGNTSVAAAVRVIRQMMSNPSAVRTPTNSLATRLAAATTDTYRRKSKKKSRNYPRRKEEPATGRPKVQLASEEQKRKLKQIQSLEVAP